MAEENPDQRKDYGLPNVEAKIIDRGQPGIAKDITPQEPDPDKKDNRAIIIAISVIGALILASLLYMIFSGDDDSQPSAQTNQVPDRAVVDENESADPSENSLEEEQMSEDNELSEELIVEEPGSIITISQRTNRYYIFVGSYKFKAYARRHAEILASDGFAVKLIAPDNWVGTRVAVGNYGTKGEARVDAEQIRSKYGNEVVISKY
jgi:cell division protein FtsN